MRLLIRPREPPARRAGSCPRGQGGTRTDRPQQAAGARLRFPVAGGSVVPREALAPKLCLFPRNISRSGAIRCQMPPSAKRPTPGAWVAGSLPHGGRQRPWPLAQRGLAEFLRVAGQRLPLAGASGTRVCTRPLPVSWPAPLVRLSGSPAPEPPWVHPGAPRAAGPVAGVSGRPARGPSAQAVPPSSWEVGGRSVPSRELKGQRSAWVTGSWCGQGWGPDGKAGPCLSPWPLSSSWEKSTAAGAAVPVLKIRFCNDYRFAGSCEEAPGSLGPPCGDISCGCGTATHPGTVAPWGRSLGPHGL